MARLRIAPESRGTGKNIVKNMHMISGGRHARQGGLMMSRTKRMPCVYLNKLFYRHRRFRFTAVNPTPTILSKPLEVEVRSQSTKDEQVRHDTPAFCLTST